MKENLIPGHSSVQKFISDIISSEMIDVKSTTDFERIGEVAFDALVSYIEKNYGSKFLQAFVSGFYE